MDLTGSVPPQLVPAVEAMRGFSAPWCVAGGWGLDLFLGRPTRRHADVDLALFREDQGHLRRHLAGWRFRKAVGGALVEWAADEWLSLPVHEIHAQPSGTATSGLELLLNERAGEHWLFRRDPAVRCPVRQVIHRSAAGLPVLCPAVILLYKAKQPRAHDEEDFRSVVDRLPPERRSWLRASLGQVHPGHPWLVRL